MIKFNNLKGDLFGGVTAGIVALPLALAFGIQAFGAVPDGASIGAYVGLTGAMLLGFFAALFGGTHSQISGPTGPMTVVTATLITGAWTSSGGNLSEVLLSMALAAIFCGLFQILFGLIKIGKYVRYIPYPVLSGFMSGIGVIIILQQIYPLIGQSKGGSMIDLLVGLPEAFGSVSLTALLLGLGTVAIIYLFPSSLCSSIWRGSPPSARYPPDYPCPSSLKKACRSPVSTGLPSSWPLSFPASP